MADEKLTQQTADATPTGDDLLYSVNDPAGTPGGRKVTWTDAATIIFSLMSAVPFTSADETKLDGIEASATADQTGAEIKTAYEAEADTNAFTDADHTKLDGIETAATADQTDAEIETAYNNQVTVVSQAEAEAGIGTTVRRWTAQRVAQAIAALAAGAGDVAGPASSTDNAVARFNGTTGKTIQNSGATLDDNGLLVVDAFQGKALVTNDETIAFTFALDDAGKLTEINNAGAVTATIPPNSSVAFPIDTILHLKQTGAGACTWTEGAGVTITAEDGKTAVTNGNPSYSFAQKTGTDAWTVGGNLVPTDAAIDQCIAISLSDETTVLTTGTAKATFRMPYAFVLTDIRSSLTTAPTGGLFTIDVNEGGTTILSTKLSIDSAEKTSTTAATAAVISDANLADDAEITVDFDTVTGSPAGAKLYLIGHKA